MKPYKTITLLVFALLAFAPAYAQMGGGMMNGDDHGGNMGEGMMNGGWCVDPDSLTEITVTGTVIVDASSMMDMYYLDFNGAFWRDPFAPRWNWMGGPMHRNGWGRHGDFGFHFGMHHDSLATVTLTGSVLVDSTLMAHYYLDKDGDGTA